MDIVYASLRRRCPGPVPPGEAAEVLAALWAHARPDDGLQHVSARIEDDRVDLLLYLLTRTPGPADADAGPARARALMDRSHLASPLLRRRYLPPAPAPATARPALP
ncbi:hypothetical protein [Streptomyces sp. NRRL B-24484]|uniref:hypothetical protein n=1 Tax=Streptomyces sp. NRRL B-24484 TaxID=1463833 RepID=UPI0006948ED1|nr:hypothetical protein [Streptomyces sp. NRRL B-24484]